MGVQHTSHFKYIRRFALRKLQQIKNEGTKYVAAVRRRLKELEIEHMDAIKSVLLFRSDRVN